MKTFILPVLICFTLDSTFAAALSPITVMDLDFASRVITGKIVQVEPASVTHSDGSGWSQATLKVTETLKGQSSETASFMVPTELKGYRGQLGMSTFSVGDTGLWIVDKKGSMVSAYKAPFPESRSAEYRQTIKELAERKWSTPVNGLEAWAMAIPDNTEDNPRNPRPPRNPAVIFAVRNASDRDIFFPIPQTPGFVHVAITNGTGYATNFSWAARSDQQLFCRRVAPGQVCYVNVSNGAFDLSKETPNLQRLALGTYSVVMSCENSIGSGTMTGSNKPVQVSAWTGRLDAPPISLTVISDSIRGR